MRFIRPGTGATEMVLADAQPEYIPLPVAIYSNSNYPTATEMLTRVTFTKEERENIAKGDDVFISELIFGSGKFAPLNVTVGMQHYDVRRDKE